MKWEGRHTYMNNELWNRINSLWEKKRKYIRDRAQEYMLRLSSSSCPGKFLTLTFALFSIFWWMSWLVSHVSLAGLWFPIVWLHINVIITMKVQLWLTLLSLDFKAGLPCVSLIQSTQSLKTKEGTPAEGILIHINNVRECTRTPRLPEDCELKVTHSCLSC